MFAELPSGSHWLRCVTVVTAGGGRVTRDTRAVSHVHVSLSKPRLAQDRTTVAGYLAAPLAYTRGVRVMFDTRIFGGFVSGGATAES